MAVRMERYRKGRLHAEHHLTVETAAGTVQAVVVDVNEYGMRLCGNFAVEAGEDLTASLRDWDLSGVIKWARRPYCGVLFDSRAPDAAIAELRGPNITPKRPGFRQVNLQDML